MASWGSDISVLGNHLGFFAFGRWFPEKETRLFFFFIEGMLMLLLSINGLLTHPALLVRLGFGFFFNIYLFGSLGS